MTILPVKLGDAKIADKPSVTVRDYLTLTQCAIRSARESVGDPTEQSVARHAAALLREARVFHLNPASYLAAYHAADVYTTTTLAGLPWTEPNLVDHMSDPRVHQPRLSALFEDGQARGAQSTVAKRSLGIKLTPEEQKRHDDARALLEAMRDGQLEEPFPSPLPFPTIYIGFGGNVGMSPFQVATALQESTVSQARPGEMARNLGFTLGHTVQHGPIVLEHIETPSDGPITISRYFDGAWNGLMSLSPWVVNSLVALINENRTIVLEQPPSAAMRYEHERVKIERLIPKPYYTLRLQPRVIDESMRRNATLGRYMFHYTYRFDVESHERIRVQRGEAPLEDKDRAKLLKRGYTVFDDHLSVPEDLLRKLDRRAHVRPRAGEWLAVLVSQIPAHEKGPENAPYVPAVRTVKEVA